MSNNENQINLIHTPCKKCSFAIYEDKTQTDCALNYLDAFRQMDGVQVLEVYDNDQEFYVVNNKKCIGYREEKWFKQYSESFIALKDKIKIYQEHNHIDYLLSINLQTLTRDDLVSILDQIYHLQIKPQILILVRYPPTTKENNKIFEYEYLKNQFDKYAFKFTWKIQTVVDPKITYGFMLHNIISTNKQNRFVASIDKNNNDIEKVINYTNDLVYNKMDTFEIISNSDKSTIIFPSIVYRYAMFMEKKNILEDNNKYQII